MQRKMKKNEEEAEMTEGMRRGKGYMDLCCALSVNFSSIHKRKSLVHASPRRRPR